jgi:predicted RNA-binding Zn ribbon-like protein
MRGLIDFLNSRASAKRAERFDTPEHAGSFLDAPADPEPWAAVNEIAATTPAHLHTASGPTVGLRAARDNPADSVIVSVLDKLASAIATGRWNRLGSCARCRRVFYDNTRSHTRRWCSYATCGNRANVASYRQRARSA